MQIQDCVTCEWNLYVGNLSYMRSQPWRIGIADPISYQTVVDDYDIQEDGPYQDYKKRAASQLNGAKTTMSTNEDRVKQINGTTDPKENQSYLEYQKFFDKMYTQLIDKQKANTDNPLLIGKSNLSKLEYKKKKN